MLIDSLRGGGARGRKGNVVQLVPLDAIIYALLFVCLFALHTLGKTH